MSTKGQTSIPVRTPSIKVLTQGSSGKVLHSKQRERGSTNRASEPDARSLRAAKAKELKTPEALPTTRGLSIGQLTLKATGSSKVKHSNIYVHMYIDI